MYTRIGDWAVGLHCVARTQWCARRSGGWYDGRCERAHRIATLATTVVIRYLLIHDTNDRDGLLGGPYSGAAVVAPLRRFGLR